MPEKKLKIITASTKPPELPEERKRIIELLKQQIKQITAQRDYWRDLAIEKQQELEVLENAKQKDIPRPA